MKKALHLAMGVLFLLIVFCSVASAKMFLREGTIEAKEPSG
jgi:hypothetical protein